MGFHSSLIAFFSYISFFVSTTYSNSCNLLMYKQLMRYLKKGKRISLCRQWNAFSFLIWFGSSSNASKTTKLSNRNAINYKLIYFSASCYTVVSTIHFSSSFHAGYVCVCNMYSFICLFVVLAVYALNKYAGFQLFLLFSSYFCFMAWPSKFQLDLWKGKKRTTRTK